MGRAARHRPASGYTPEQAERKRLYDAAYYVSHRAKMKASSQRWRVANPAKVREYQLKYAATHQEEERIRQKARPPKRIDPEKNRERVHRRRAFERGAFAEEVEMAVLVERDGSYCGICHRRVKPAERSIDHVLPVSKGGAHSYANTRLTHLKCNILRNNRGAAQLRLVG